MRVQPIPHLICCLATLLSELVSGQESSLEGTRDWELPVAESPAEVGLDETKFAQIRPLIDAAIHEGKLPGCVVMLGRHGKVAFQESYGLRKLPPDPEPMTVSTVFDMASITKPVATATSVMLLHQGGRLELSDLVSQHIPEFGTNGKEAITIQDLLVHQSGLTPDNPLRDYLDGPAAAWQRIWDLGLVGPVGSEFRYSDVNFIVLAKLVEEVSQRDIHQYSREQIFAPLGMTETGYLPARDLCDRAAPTEKRDDVWMRGKVHDPRAFELGGIAGHAGLFATASDLALYAQMMLGNGTLRIGKQAVQILEPQTVEMMTAARSVSRGTRGLGWDKRSPYSSNRGSKLSSSAFGHGGFTGTVLWIDPELDLFFIFLSNRVHPNGTGSVNRLAGAIVDVFASAVLP